MFLMIIYVEVVLQSSNSSHVMQRLALIVIPAKLCCQRFYIYMFTLSTNKSKKKITVHFNYKLVKVANFINQQPQRFFHFFFFKLIVCFRAPS